MEMRSKPRVHTASYTGKGIYLARKNGISLESVTGINQVMQLDLHAYSKDM